MRPLWVLVAAAAIVVAGGGALAIALLPDDSAGPERGVTLANVVDRPESFVGRTVTVSGDVSETNIRPRAFAIGDDVDETALVLPARDARLNAWPHPDDVARVTGVVQIFRPSYLREREDLDAFAGSVFLEQFDGDPMILVERVQVLEEGTTSPYPGDQG